MMFLNKSFIFSTLIFSCPAIIYYVYVTNLQKKINIYENTVISINKKFNELNQNYKELLDLLNVNLDGFNMNIIKNINDETETEIENKNVNTETDK